MPKLLITKGPERGRVLRIANDDPPTIGREDADIVVDDSYISKKHARFVMKDDRWYIEDLGSANGTYVNGERIAEPVKLRRGDRIQIGQTKIVVSPKTQRKKNNAAEPDKDQTQSDKSEPVVDTDSPPPPSEQQKVETDSLDASSLLLDVLGDMDVDEAGDIEEEDDDYIPDYDPADPSTHRAQKKPASPTDKTSVPGEEKKASGEKQESGDKNQEAEEGEDEEKPESKPDA